MKCQCIVTRRSGIQTEMCPFIKVIRSMWPLLPWPSIWIHSEMSDTGRAICAPSQKLLGARVPSFRRSSLACYKQINSEMSDDSPVPPPPPFLKLREVHVLPSPFPLLIHSENCFTGWATCAPFSKVRRGTCPLLSPILAGRDAWH